ncbi:TraX family protein [Clostridiaceae bacterium M8S5]|nr:TraX family protein [Clostridiaceae bacterium M8S5]
MNSNRLKMFACIIMLIDHTALIINNDIVYRVMRSVGRLSFPIFAFLIAEGFYHTKNAKKYLARLFIFALISQVPFSLYFESKILDLENLNIFTTLFAGLLSIYIYDKNKYIGMVVVIVLAYIAKITGMDYGYYGVLIIFGFYIFRESKLKKSLYFIGLTIIYTVELCIEYNFIGFATTAQMIAIISTILICFYNGKKGKANLKYFFYMFYPVHLFILTYVRLYY